MEPVQCEPAPLVNDTIPNPCDQADSLEKDQAIINLLSGLKTKALNPLTINETSHIYLNNSNGILDYATVEGEPGEAGIDLQVHQPVDGCMHNHFNGLLSIFSPDDLWSMFKLSRDNNMVNPSTFNIFVTTASETQYLLKIEDSVKFKNFASKSLSQDFWYFKFTYQDTWEIDIDNDRETNEKAFLRFLKQSNGGSGLKLFKGNADFSEWTPLGLDRDNNVVPEPCLYNKK